MRESDRRGIFAEWLAAHRGLLFKVVRAYALTPQDQEDLFQEIAVQLWRSTSAFRGESAITTWIYRVALRAAIAWTRRERRHRNSKPLDTVESAILHVSSAYDPRVDWLYEQIRQLNEIDRSLTLLLLDGFSYKEMATMLGITETNVGVKITRIKARLTARTQKESRHGI
ncbi:MAG TPA: RNA polymerase sigma factor [Acidobacteriaceae bacterium]|jgi:RNA polymerase sigma-70 factor (ECF subfamily)